MLWSQSLPLKITIINPNASGLIGFQSSYSSVLNSHSLLPPLYSLPHPPFGILESSFAERFPLILKELLIIFVYWREKTRNACSLRVAAYEQMRSADIIINMN